VLVNIVSGIGNGYHPSGVALVWIARTSTPRPVFTLEEFSRGPDRRTTAMARTLAARKMHAYSTLVIGYGVAAAVASTGVILWLTIQAARFI